MTESASGHDSTAMLDFVVLLNRAADAQERKNASEYAMWLDEAAHLHPVDRPSRHALVPRLINDGRSSTALAIAQANVRLDPEDAIAVFGLGYVFQMTGRNPEAARAYRHAHALDPTIKPLRRNLATALHRSGGDQKEVIQLLQETVRIDPSDSDAWADLSYYYRRYFDLDAALAAGHRAIELAPGNVVGLENYVAALKDAARWEEAHEVMQAAGALQPDNATFRFALAAHKLICGDYEGGWPGHEFRWKGTTNENAIQRPVFPCPTWQGESLAGKTLYLWGEQGLGDVFQFCRYVPMLARRVHENGGRLVWNCFPALASLLQRSLGQHADLCVSGAWDPAVHADYEVPLLSLPLRFNTREETIPADVPYLFAAADAAAAWHNRLAAEKRLKVGLAWTGSRTHNRNPYRTVGLNRLASHFKSLQERVAFFSLQPGAHADVAAARASGFEIDDYTSELSTYDDTAAFVASLDLVISVCTSAAHLSGAMGKRTWVLLDSAPHWVWQLNRTDTPWYPGTTLYRQEVFGQWLPVLGKVTQDLHDLARCGELKT